MIIVSIFGFAAVFYFMCIAESRQLWSEKALIKDLLHDYEKRARPVVDGVSKTVSLGDTLVQQITVEFGLSLIQILDLNENEQTLTVSVKLIYRWQDHHLIWNPEDYDNITYITIPTAKIWIPDIALYNYADERPQEKRECGARVNHNGTIEWYPMAIYKSTCPVKIKYFPYDKQNCTLRFGPWTYDSARLNISFRTSNFETNDYIASTEWNLTNYRTWMKIRKYVCCPEVYADTLFEILIERQPAYYNHLLILPCFLLSAVTLVLFWLPPETPAKMVLGLNIFTAFFLLLLLLNDSIPQASSSYPLIGNYYCINMTLVTVSTFLCLMVVNMHFRGDRQTELPLWLKKLAFNHAARYLFVNVNPPKPPRSPAKKKKKTSKTVERESKESEDHLIYRSQTRGAGIHFTDIPPYPHLHFPSNPDNQPYPQYAPYPTNPRWNQRPDVHYGAPPINTMPLYNPEYPDQMYTESAAPTVCSFCPACAGLAAVQAANLGDNEPSDSIEQAPPQLQASCYNHRGLPSQPFARDPAEQLAAVWASAMTGLNVNTCQPPYDKRTALVDVETYGKDAEDEVDEEEEEDQLNTFTSSRDRSLDPELECFLLECIRPQSTKRGITEATLGWTGSSKTKQPFPASPFYQFSSPQCDDEPESSDNDWQESRCHETEYQVARSESDDEEEDSTHAPGLWRTSSGRSSHKSEGHQKSVTRDKILLKRVQKVKRDVSEIVKGIRFMQRINENKERINEIIAEWRTFGMVLDRFFFVIYLCALGISIIMYFPRSGDEDDKDHD